MCIRDRYETREVYPAPDDIFNAFAFTPLKDVKVEMCIRDRVRYVQMTGKQRKLYDGQAINLRSLLDQQSEEEFNNSRFQVLTELTRLRQICCDPALCFEDYGDETAKRDACMELVQSAVDGGRK